MTCGKILNKSGFTLIEIIVTMVIVASLSGIMIVLISHSLSSSSDPVLRFRNASELSIVMANINDDYYKCPVWTPQKTYAPNSFVKPSVWNGKYYKCQSCTSDCKSGTSEPQWLSQPPITDNNIIWTETIDKGPLLTQSVLKQNIANTNYGKYYNYKDGAYEYVTYRVVYNDIVPTPPPGTSTILKVTIADRYYGRVDRQSQMLTSYFISN